jgi:hypothetical protein
MATSFQTHVAPLFRAGDVGCMAARGVRLDDYAYMSDAPGDGGFADHANARHVLARLTGDEKPRMPKGGPYWNDEQIALFERWMSDGFLP